MNDVRRTKQAAHDLARSCMSVLGHDLRAVVLHGSLTLGDFEPGRSDIDLMLITEPAGLSETERDGVVDAVEDAKTGAARAIDLIAVTSTIASHPSRAPASELQVSRYPDTVDVQSHSPADEDVAVELSMARAAGQSLFGQPVPQVIGPVPPEWVNDRGRDWLQHWMGLTDDAEHAEFMVLTACRIWHYAAEGTFCSKPEAGRWALARNPALTAVTNALRQRRGDLDARIAPAEIARVLTTVLEDGPS